MRKVRLGLVIFVFIFITSCSKKGVSENSNALKIENNKSTISTQFSSIEDKALYVDNTKRPLTPSHKITPSLEQSKMPSFRKELMEYLPPLNTTLSYHGTEKYKHFGVFHKVSSNNNIDLYDFYGTYDDDFGITNKFVLRYKLDTVGGTMTEMIVSNARTDGINSKIHSLKLLEFPLYLNKTWKENIKFDGVDKIVIAEITKIDLLMGEVNVRYTVKNVLGYYQDTYFEERVFKKKHGVISFSKLLSGDLKETEKLNSETIKKALENKKFSYELSSSNYDNLYQR